MREGIYTVHYEQHEELLERPMYPSIGYSYADYGHGDSALAGARKSTAAFLRAARRLGCSVSVISPPGRRWDGDVRVYLVHCPARTIVVELDTSPDVVEYHKRRQAEIGADMRARGELE